MTRASQFSYIDLLLLFASRTISFILKISSLILSNHSEATLQGISEVRALFFEQNTYCFPNCRVDEAAQRKKKQCLHFDHSGVTPFVLRFLDVFWRFCSEQLVFPFLVCLQNLHNLQLTIFLPNVHFSVKFSMFLASIFQMTSKLKLVLVYKLFKEVCSCLKMETIY